MNYQKLISQAPTVYDSFVNRRGQTIELVEHPELGEEYPVICVCHELQLAAASEFWDTEDMLADHGEYEPSFVSGELVYGLN